MEQFGVFVVVVGSFTSLNSVVTAEVEDLI